MQKQFFILAFIFGLSINLWAADDQASFKVSQSQLNSSFYLATGDETLENVRIDIYKHPLQSDGNFHYELLIKAPAQMQFAIQEVSFTGFVNAIDPWDVTLILFQETERSKFKFLAQTQMNHFSDNFFFTHKINEKDLYFSNCSDKERSLNLISQSRFYQSTHNYLDAHSIDLKLVWRPCQTR
jgi:hypothetical protein